MTDRFLNVNESTHVKTILHFLCVDDHNISDLACAWDITSPCNDVFARNSLCATTCMSPQNNVLINFPYEVFPMDLRPIPPHPYDVSFAQSSWNFTAIMGY